MTSVKCQEKTVLTTYSFLPPDQSSHNNKNRSKSYKRSRVNPEPVLTIKHSVCKSTITFKEPGGGGSTLVSKSLVWPEYSSKSSPDKSETLIFKYTEPIISSKDRRNNKTYEVKSNKSKRAQSEQRTPKLIPDKKSKEKKDNVEPSRSKEAHQIKLDNNSSSPDSQKDQVLQSKSTQSILKSSNSKTNGSPTSETPRVKFYLPSPSDSSSSSTSSHAPGLITRSAVEFSSASFSAPSSVTRINVGPNQSIQSSSNFQSAVSNEQAAKSVSVKKLPERVLPPPLRKALQSIMSPEQSILIDNNQHKLVLDLESSCPDKYDVNCSIKQETVDKSNGSTSTEKSENIAQDFSDIEADFKQNGFKLVIDLTKEDEVKSYRQFLVEIEAIPAVSEEPASIRELIELLFAELDSDHDSLVDLDTAEDVLTKLNNRFGRYYSDMDVTDLLYSLDSDADGSITLQEFRSAFAYLKL